MDELSFLKSLSCECLHKVEVINPHTGELQLVPCGHCPACYYRKSISNELKVKSARVISKYCYFVTLTYNVFCCPSYRINATRIGNNMLRCDVVDSNLRVDFLRRKHPLTRRGFSKVPLEPFSFVCSEEYYKRFTSQANLAIRKHSFDHRFDNTYGYLNHRDLSLFMKRLRQIISPKLNPHESLHSYIVGEYGIDHFRPHFHLLLFFNSDEVASRLGSALNKCWPFGRVDYSFERGKSAQYVAGYLNSVTYLPLHIRTHRRISPFSRFSNGFAQALFDKTKKKAKEGDFSDFFNGVSCAVDDKTFIFRPTESVRNSCFFKPASYRGATVGTLLSLLYDVCKSARAFSSKGVKTCHSSARNFAKSLSDSKFLDYLFSSKYYSHLFYYIGLHRFNSFFLRFDDFQKKIISRIYTLYRQTDLFLRNLGFSVFSFDFSEKDLYLPLSNSISFYHEYFYKNYQSYCENRDRYPSDYRSYFFRVSSETQQRFLDTPFGRHLKEYQHQLVLQRIKHREINEKNKFFVSS